ncbi:MAG: dihydrofolate reductase [Clostridia bacterium]|nr:dihydrofolate reductase [Clostridia bacterium]
MISIAAVDKNWGIGKNNKLPWKIPGEQRFFREKTYGKTIIMGRRTLESLPGGKPLEGRRNIIMTRNENAFIPGAETAGSPEEVLSLIHGLDPDDVFVIGGAQIYRLLIPYCEKALITRINGVYDVDSHHPDLDSDPNWRVASVLQEVTCPGGVSYAVHLYENRFFLG